MTKPMTLPEPEPRKIQRADRPPSEGFSLVVDSHFKNQYDDETSAKAAAADLLTRYPMLQIEIYDGVKGERVKFS